MDMGRIPEDLRPMVAFHGHLCPGLLIGYRASKIAIERLGIDRDRDEEICARVENDSCAVDAIQFLTGCTFGKGNLLFEDNGKHVYTFWDRRRNRALRISLRSTLSERHPEMGALRKKALHRPLSAEEEGRLQTLRREMEGDLLTVPDEELFAITESTEPIPGKARVMDSIPCDRCGEGTMETRIRLLFGKRLCIPCFREMERRG